MADANMPEAREIVTRAQARERGLKHYFTGIPCKNGHTTPRLVSNADCCGCSLVFSKAWREANPQKRRDTYTSWVERNKDQHYAATARWGAANPEKKKAYVRNWFARRKNAEGSHTGKDVADLLVMQRRHCAGCGTSIKRGFEVDHITPLSRGGSNAKSNIQLLCQSCNRRKSAKDPIAWAQENGRLL